VVLEEISACHRRRSIIRSAWISAKLILYYFDIYIQFWFFELVFHYASPITLTYAWSFGSLAGICLVIQMISGIFLAWGLRFSYLHICLKIEVLCATQSWLHLSCIIWRLSYWQFIYKQSDVLWLSLQMFKAEFFCKWARFSKSIRKSD